ncbi:carbon storage regulator [Neorhodopirellula pilleata]|uniref:Translational regulator CsrA n=1 Tax=Neorhodopirellula pilleata TaxID=2714738 RepID=A0A5C6ACZ5_9BACT|nr:carbon storage regulator [Neorhodopirellula pilleata]TWT97286.1 Carbon storage regulator [Neorhodopirellula pilleata]
MLVLSRKEGEKLVIGDNVVITINRIAGNRVAVGIEAPRDVSIVRGELKPQVNQSKKTGSSGSPSAAASMLQSDIAVASQLDR